MADSAILKCRSCGTKNRIPLSRVKDHPKCGKCSAPLKTDAIYTRPVTVTDTTFEREVMGFDGSVLVQCWAPWCGHCRSMEPVLNALAMDYAGQLKIARINVEENPQVSSRFRVMSLPQLFLIKKGNVIDSIVGALPRQEIEKKLAVLL